MGGNGNDSMEVGREWEHESHSRTPLLHIRTCPVYPTKMYPQSRRPKMNFLRQDFPQSSYYTHTHIETDAAKTTVVTSADRMNSREEITIL